MSSQLPMPKGSFWRPPGLLRVIITIFELKDSLRAAFKFIKSLGLSISGSYFIDDSAFDTKAVRSTCLTPMFTNAVLVMSGLLLGLTNFGPLLVRYDHYAGRSLHCFALINLLWLVASRSGKYPHTDDGVKVRRIFHKLRSQYIEPFNGLFKNVFEWGRTCSSQRAKTDAMGGLGAVLLYQLVLLYQFQHRKPLGVGIKPF